jgi:hypothetical protein
MRLIENPVPRDKYKSFILVDDDDDDFDDDFDELESATIKALKDTTPINVLHFWRILYDNSLDSACLEGPTKINLSKLSNAIRSLKCKSDIMVIMEYATYLRTVEKPYWPGAEIRNPTVGLFASAERLTGFLRDIMDSDTWASRRAKYALIHAGSIQNMKTMLTAKEFVALSKFLPSQ